MANFMVRLAVQKRQTVLVWKALIVDELSLSCLDLHHLFCLGLCAS